MSEYQITYTYNTAVTGDLDHADTDAFYVGASNKDGTLSKLSTGKLRHVRIYKKAESATEIRQNYMDFCGNPASSDGLVFWGALNEGNWTTSGGDDFVYDRIYNAAGEKSGTIAFEVNDDNSLIPVHRLATTYQYNSLNQVLFQKSPDADSSVFYYDRLGRLTASQNKEQKDNASYSGSAARFSYTKYDAQGRINEVGEKSGATDLSGIDMLDTAIVRSWLASGTDRQITKTIYDNPINLYQGTGTSRKRVVASIYVENATDTEGDSTLYGYDILGNVKTSVQHVKSLVAVDTSNGKKKIDYEYDLVSGKVNLVSYQHGKGDQFYYKYSYDADNRVIRSYSSRDKLVWIEDASYNYYLHGPLARTELGHHKVQGIDYAYTLQGWLKGINSDSLSQLLDMANDGRQGATYSRVSRDVYGFKLGYYNNDYIPIGGATADAFVKKDYTAPTSLEATGNQLFNGNISFTTISLSKINSSATAGYGYGYDQLNRLVEMRQHTTGTTGGWSNSNIITAYRESITYDANGNILRYLRNGNAATTDMDSLNYSYTYSSGMLVNNKLDHVRDQVGSGNYSVDIDNQSSGNYAYDKIGNLKRDVAESIDTIRWTVYGKINKIVKSGGATTIEYGYNPGGNRIYKKVTSSGDTARTWYIRDSQGNVLGLYSKQNTSAIKWDEQHLYGSIRLGMWNWDTIVPANPPVVDEDPVYDSLMLGSRTYELNNHLGNVLSTISDKKVGNDSSGTVNYYLAEVLSQNDFYPGGMEMPGRKYNNGNQYRYGFQKQETDNELWGGALSFKYRVEDPRLVRFFSVDPLADKYPHNSPYAFSENKTISCKELEGLESVYVFVTGEYMLGVFGNSVTLGFAIDREGIAWGGSSGGKLGIGISASAGAGATVFPTMERLESMEGLGESITVSGEFIFGGTLGIAKSSGYIGGTGSFNVGIGFQFAYEQSFTKLSRKVTWNEISNYLKGLNHSINDEGLKRLITASGLNSNSSISTIKNTVFGFYKPLMIEGIDKSITARESTLKTLRNNISSIDEQLSKLNSIKKPDAFVKAAIGVLNNLKSINEIVAKEQQKQADELKKEKADLEKE